METKLPKQQKFGEQIKEALLIVLILLFILAGVSTFFLYTRIRHVDKLLISTVKQGEGVKISYTGTGSNQNIFTGSDVSLEGPFAGNNNPQMLIEHLGIVGASTGEIKKFELEDSSGRVVADATGIQIVTITNSGNIKKLTAILQIFPEYKPDENIVPWFIKFAANFRNTSFAGNSSERLPNEEIIKVFPRGSLWEFKPLYNLDSPLISEELKEEYIPLARRYYGDDTSDLLAFLEKGMETRYTKPILLFGVNLYP